MSSPKRAKSSLLAALAGLLLTLGTGCARTVTFAVTRPALVNLQPSGNTIAVGNIRGNGHPDAAVDVAADLRERVAHSLNPSIRLVSAGGGVTITGAIVDDRYDEHTETVSATCSRTVDDGTDANGNPQSHSESYDCSYDVTVGVANSQIRFLIVAGEGQGKVVYDQSYAQSSQITNPARGDGQHLLHQLRGMSVETFAKVILPWQDVVAERFKDCDGDSRCKQGFEAAKKGDLTTAEGLFSQVIGGMSTGSVVPAAQVERIGEAFYDRAVVRAHQQRYDEAVADLESAIQLQPKRAKWPAELESVKQMARDTQALRAQGATP